MAPKISSSDQCSLEKKTRILDAAKTRFLHYGVSKSTMREIAEDVGIAVSNLYLYFENKREMVLAIAEECRNEQDKIDQQLISSQELPASVILENVLLSRFHMKRAFREDSPHGGELIQYLLQEYPERAQQWQDAFESLIFTVLSIGIERGEFHLNDPHHAARMVRLAILGCFLPPYIELPIMPTEEDLIALTRWLVNQFQKHPNSP